MKRKLFMSISTDDAQMLLSTSFHMVCKCCEHMRSRNVYFFMLVQRPLCVQEQLHPQDVQTSAST